MAAALPLRSFEYWTYRYRQTWHGTLVTGMLTPVMFLAAMGLGLGHLVAHGRGRVDGVTYLVFLAPGLLASNAMQVAAGESSWPVLASIKWQRTYQAMLATPIGVRDVLLGHLAWMAVRISMVTTFFFAAMAAFGTLQSWWALAALPAAILTGLAFAVPLTAYAATRETGQGFAAVYRFVITPLFLFAGTFFPVSQLPSVLRPLAYVAPLWHGVSLCRSLVLGRVGLDALGHVAVLVAVTAVGFAAARVTFRRRLEV